MEKCAATEKSLLDECRNTESKRRQALEALAAKTLEIVPQHLMDVNIITVLAERLEKTQTAIKARAAVVNTAFGSCHNGYEVLRKLAETDAARCPEEEIWHQIGRMLEDFETAATSLGCLRPDQPIPVPLPVHLEPEPPKTPIPAGKAKSSNRKSSPMPPAPPPPPPKPPDPPTDFQLTTIDGPLPLVNPGIIVLPDPKSVRAGKPEAASTIDMGKKPRGSVTGPRGSITGNKKNLKKLERFFVFGDAPTDHPVTFLEVVHKECWMALNDVLAAAEEYYRLKGNRPVTRPQLLPPTAELLAERLCKKLLNYQTQSENFAHYVMEKMRDLSKKIIEMVPRLAAKLFREIFTPYKLEMLIVQRLTVEKFNANSASVRDSRRDVDVLQLPEELVRNNAIIPMLEVIADRMKSYWDGTLSQVTLTFLSKFIRCTDAFFRECDRIIPPRDVKRPLLPHAIVARPPSPPVDTPELDPGPKTWKALDTSDMATADTLPTGVDIACEKTTLAHVELNETRHAVFREFLELYRQMQSTRDYFAVEKENVQRSMEIRAFQQLQLRKLEAVGLMRTV